MEGATSPRVEEPDRSLARWKGPDLRELEFLGGDFVSLGKGHP